MTENYGETRDIDTMRKKHIRLYIYSKAGTATQLRPLKCAIKSCFKHLCKRGVIKIDPAKDFESGKQNPPKFERNLSASDVRLFFKEASKMNDQRTHVMLQILCYGGLRLKVLSQLPCSSIIRTEFLKNKKKRFSLFNCCQKSKGQQVETRCVAQRHWTPSLQLRAVTKQVWSISFQRKEQEQADASTKCIDACQANCKEGWSSSCIKSFFSSFFLFQCFV
jgi:site-specific recombinase XerC